MSHYLLVQMACCNKIYLSSFLLLVHSLLKVDLEVLEIVATLNLQQYY